MSKNLKLSFVLFILMAAVSVAWSTLGGFFSGVGINFIVLVISLSVVLHFIITDGYVKSRVMDLFVCSCVLTALELIVFVCREFGWINAQAVRALSIYQSIVSLLALIFLIYILFRFFTETKNVRVNFVETMLGNNAKEKKEKKSKELTNGSLEDKPNRVKEESEVTETIEVETADTETDEN